MRSHPDGSGLSILPLSFLSLLAISEALKLSNPPSVLPGQSFTINWTFSPDDPRVFNLRIGLCNNSGSTGSGSDSSFFYHDPAIYIQQSSQHARIEKALDKRMKLPAACLIQALDSDTEVVIDSNSIEIMATSNSSMPFAIVLSTSTRTIKTSVPSSTAKPSIMKTSSTARTSTMKTSVTSSTARKPIGPLVGGVLRGVFALLVLLSFIVLCNWRRRQREHQSRSAEPFVPDETYVQRANKWEEFKDERAADDRVVIQTLQSNQQPTLLVATNNEVGNSGGSSRTETETGMRTGSGPVQEEVTRLRERVNALENQLRRAVVPSEYSSL
ncbi:hypothetical protein E4T56_gene19663 [Termitomyces sp. T112]|nr:hypothetical protein E4T56_gene19663 [Termitomyces sp. T112]